MTTSTNSDSLLADWRDRALRLEDEVAKAVIGQPRAVRLLTVAVFARGHVLMEGDVGVGKTTLLRTMARAVGGSYERIEGTIDLLPSDLAYYTYIGSDGKPKVDPGPLLKHGESLSVFFFNEINRARPQVHSLLLRTMAERSVTAFNREYSFPHLQVFADRNRIEKEETYELPSAARDRFLMEILITAPTRRSDLADLMFEQRYHDADKLIQCCARGVVDYGGLNSVGERIQGVIQASDTLRSYALDLCLATRRPLDFGVSLSEVDNHNLVQAGASPRGMSMMLRAARVVAWLNDRTMLIPEDIQEVFHETIAHRIFFSPVYEMRRSEVAPDLVRRVLNQVATP
jgi:MoxR-like ATPase